MSNENKEKDNHRGNSGFLSGSHGGLYLGDDGEIDLSKFTPITYDPVHHGYYRLGERVGNAFKDGAKLK